MLALIRPSPPTPERVFEIRPTPQADNIFIDNFAGDPGFLRLLLVLFLERRDDDPRVIEAWQLVTAQGFFLKQS